MSQNCQEIKRRSKNLPWGVVAGKASLAHAGAIVDNQGLDFVTHLVGEGLLRMWGWEWSGWCDERLPPLNPFSSYDLIRRWEAGEAIRERLKWRSLYGDVAI